jgi:hypothetical protein
MGCNNGEEIQLKPTWFLQVIQKSFKGYRIR